MADELNLTDEKQPPSKGGAPSASPGDKSPFTLTTPFNLDEVREAARGDLARGLIWLLALAIGGVLLFVGIGRIDGTVITQSIFPSLVALAGTALGFYFGSSTKSTDSAGPPGPVPGPVAKTAPLANAGADQTVKAGSTVELKGSGSSASGAIMSYAWTLTTIPSESAAALTGADGATPSFVTDKAGTYTAQLIVNDGTASAPSTVNITATA